MVGGSSIYIAWSTYQRLTRAEGRVVAGGPRGVPVVRDSIRACASEFGRWRIGDVLDFAITVQRTTWKARRTVGHATDIGDRRSAQPDISRSTLWPEV